MVTRSHGARAERASGARYVLGMLFHVHAQDRPGIGTELYDLAEEHWSYMDRFEDRLVLRGPTLSEDGEDHTGSVHVIEVADRAAAERFAIEEPYWRADLYRGFMAVRAEVLLDRGPTEDPSLREEPHSLVTGEWPPESRGAGFGEVEGRTREDGADDRLSFVAVLVDDDAADTVGIVAAVRALPEEAAELLRPLAAEVAGAPVTLTSQRWQRGGRS